MRFCWLPLTNSLSLLAIRVKWKCLNDEWGIILLNRTCSNSKCKIQALKFRVQIQYCCYILQTPIKIWNWCLACYLFPGAKYFFSFFFSMYIYFWSRTSGEIQNIYFTLKYNWNSNYHCFHMLKSAVNKLIAVLITFFVCASFVATV